MRAPAPRNYYLLTGFITGLIIRYLMLFYKGVFDMDAYFDWGKKALAVGFIANTHL